MKLSKLTIMLAGITVFTVLAVWKITTGRGYSASPTETVGPSPTTVLSGWQTRQNSGGNVTVAVTPQELTLGKPAVFLLVFDTHSVNLDFDVALSAALRDNQGTTYGVPVWNGDPAGGHHRTGTLSFPALRKQTTSVTLMLTNVAGVAERSFVWKL